MADVGDAIDRIRRLGNQPLTAAVVEAVAVEAARGR
jgi:hypothetical protein